MHDSKPPASGELKLNITPGEHVIGSFIGDEGGPTLIVIGSLHGNEPAGALALENIAPLLEPISEGLNGRVYFLAGNTRAIAAGRRFIETDLNRLWRPLNMSRTGWRHMPDTSDGNELLELNDIIDHILVTARDEVYVIDLHSTSADGMPFATVGDTLRNRAFARKFPVTILLGIEEQLEGTMLEYLNNAGAVTFGFEGGQHTSPVTIETHEAIVWLALGFTGILTDPPVDLETIGRGLRERGSGSRVFEVRYRHAITPGDDFVMDPGYNNFDPVQKGTIVAHERSGPVRFRETGLILMPLYQKLGEDGFFIGREISPFWLGVSRVLRRLHVPGIVHWLPGVALDPDDKETLVVDTTVARFFPLHIFHLLGFRRRRWSEHKLIVSRRKHDLTSPFTSGA